MIALFAPFVGRGGACHSVMVLEICVLWAQYVQAFCWPHFSGTRGSMVGGGRYAVRLNRHSHGRQWALIVSRTDVVYSSSSYTRGWM